MSEAGKLATVHTLYEVNAADIPAMLREAAESITSEAEEDVDPTRAMIAVQVTEGGQIKVYGWGQTDTMDSIAVLHMGAAKLMQPFIVDDD